MALCQPIPWAPPPSWGAGPLPPESRLRHRDPSLLNQLNPAPFQGATLPSSRPHLPQPDPTPQLFGSGCDACCHRQERGQRRGLRGWCRAVVCREAVGAGLGGQCCQGLPQSPSLAAATSPTPISHTHPDPRRYWEVREAGMIWGPSRGQEWLAVDLGTSSESWHCPQPASSSTWLCDHSPAPAP